MLKDKPLVIVLSRNYSTGISVIRSLGAAGYTVDLLASAYKAGASYIAARSKYVRYSKEVVSKKVKDGNDDNLVNELLKYGETLIDKAVLFPTDDYTASIVDLNREQLDKYFYMPYIVGGEAGTMVQHMDKAFQSMLAESVGLMTPKEWVFSLEEEIIIPDDMVYPCFCKPMESISGYKKEMAVCSDELQLKRHLHRLRRKYSKRNILVQEYLNIDQEIDLSGVCVDQKIIIPAIIKKTHVAQHEKGVTLAGKVVEFEELGDLKNRVIEMMQAFHYVGMFDLELNIVGDKIYFNEINLRSGGPNYAYFMSGVNLPEIFVKEVTGNIVSENDGKVSEYGKNFIYEKVAWDDYIHGFFSKKELNNCIANADIKLLYNEDDIEPWNIFLKDVKRKLIRTRLKKFKSKFAKKIKSVLRPCKNVICGYPQARKSNDRNLDKGGPRVLVTGRNYCTNLSIARSLGEAGYSVEVLRIFQTKPKRNNIIKRYLRPDAYSKYIKAYYVCVSERRSRRIVRRLKRIADKTNKMLLIPADDLMAYIIDDYLDELSDYYLLPNINHRRGEVIKLMNKDIQKRLARDAGLPVANSWHIKTVNGEYEIPTNISYPCFVKPNVSKNSSKSRMRKCESREELAMYLAEISSRKDVDMIIEEFLNIKKEYSILGLSTSQGAIGPGFFVAEENGAEEHRGVAVTGRVLSCDNMAIIDKVIEFISTLNFEGLYDVDLVETEEGKIYFVELNLRFGASGYAITKCGVNLPGMFADYMIKGYQIDYDCMVIENNKTFVSEKVLLEEYIKGRISWKKYRLLLNSADISFIRNKGDLKAYRHFKKCYLIAWIFKRITQYREG